MDEMNALLWKFSICEVSLIILGTIIGVFLGNLMFPWFKNRNLNKLNILDLEERIESLEQNSESYDDIIDILERHELSINELKEKEEENYQFEILKPSMQIEETKVRRKPGPKPKIQE